MSDNHTLQTVNPENINIKNGLVGSRLSNTEMEIVACHIITISRQQGGWFSFTVQEFCEMVGVVLDSDLLTALQNMTKRNILNSSEGKYTPTNNFVATLAEYIE